MNKVLVTGANGFVGHHLCGYFRNSGYQVVAAVRSRAAVPVGCETAVIGNIGPETDWARSLQDVSTVIHLAARVHVMREEELDPLESFRSVNLYGTECLAKAAISAGVRRFIFVSSVKVNGECTYDRPFSAADTPHPEDSYAQSKWEAEQALCACSEASGMDLVVIRPPLIYGAGVKGNLRRLLNLVAKGIPLPLGGIQNHRSLLNVSNLSHFIQTCLEQPQAWGQTYMVADGHDLSSPQLISGMAAALGRKPRLFQVPMGLLRLGGRLTGQQAAIDRLCGNLQVDIGKNRELLGWSPPFSVEHGLQDMVRSTVT